MDNDTGHIIQLFETNNALVKKVTEGIRPDQWVQKPGDASNPMFWIMGHLIWNRGNIVKTLGADGAAPWAPLFARVAKLGAEDQYPRVDEICTTWDNVSKRLIACLSSVPADIILTQPHDKPTFDGKTGGASLSWRFMKRTMSDSWLISVNGLGTTRRSASHLRRPSGRRTANTKSK